MTTEVERAVAQRDDRAVAKLAEDLALLADAGAVIRGRGNFQHLLAAIRVVRKDSNRGRPPAEAALHNERADPVVLCELQGIYFGLIGLRWPGELIFGEVKVLEEVRHRRVAMRRVGSRRAADELGDPGRSAVEVGGDLQPLVALEACGEAPERRSGLHAGEDVIADRADRKDVEALRVGLDQRHRLGRNVRRGLVVDEVQDVLGPGDCARERAALEPDAGLPTADAQVLALGPRADDQDVAG
ncbi:unannotated protein [freshwater metagenome]|uniref:Unannotated protein n=1 Tax=freshwater metagenome TaxID=449393 RepID=A0A6J7FEK8_9ZZZZ